MSDKKVTMTLELQTTMPSMPAQGYGSGTPANSNQDWFAADTVGGAGMQRGKFTPNKWAGHAQALADFHLSRGRAVDEGWGTNHPASDLSQYFFTNQGRYQASIPGTAAHQAVSGYNAMQKHESSQKREEAIREMDAFVSKLQTAATSLAYLTGASGGVANAMNRAASVFAAFQGVQGVLGMGGTSVGGLLQGHGLGSAFGTGVAQGIGASALGIAGLGIAGIGMAGAYGPASLMPRNDHSFGGEVMSGFFGTGGHVSAGSSRNILAQLQSDWNRGYAQNIGGGKVNDYGQWISQQRQLDVVQQQQALRMNQWHGSMGLEQTRLSGLAGLQAFRMSEAVGRNQFMGYGGYADNVGVLGGAGGYTGRTFNELAEQPRSLTGLMNRVYGNDFQAGGELSMRLQGIGEQARGYAQRRAGLDVQMEQVGNRKLWTQQHLQEVQANTRRAIERDGPGKGAEHASRQMEVELQQRLVQLTQEEAGIRKSMRETETGILDAKRQQAVATQQVLQGIINSERQGQDQSKLSYGRSDPGQRAYVKSVLSRFDKSGREGVSYDEMGIVEQYRRREAEAIYRKTADDEGFSDKGTLRDRVIKDSEAELGKQKALTVELSRQIDVKLELDNKKLEEELRAELGPIFQKITITMRQLATQVEKIAEGMHQMQSNLNAKQ